MRNKIRSLAATALVFASLTQLASASFVDVPPDHKLYPVVSVLEQDGIIFPDTDNKFSPNRKVTCMESIAAVWRAFKDPTLLEDNIYKTNLRKLELIRTPINWHKRSDTFLSDICELLITVKGLPVLQPSLYDMEAKDNYVFSAYIYGYIDEIGDPDKRITMKDLCDMIYRAKYINPNPHIPEPTKKISY